LLVEATQCEHPETIATDTGFRGVSKGDWVVHGENGETYVVDNAFFQRTFAPLQHLFLEAEDRGRPPLRLLICANGGNPGAQSIVGSSRTALLTSSLFLWDRALLTHSTNFTRPQANERSLQEISPHSLFAPSEPALRMIGGMQDKDIDRFEDHEKRKLCGRTAGEA
jgi:hypothetical protein